jgi:hypothetical protein
VGIGLTEALSAIVDQGFRSFEGIVKLSEFEQKLGNTRIHNPLIIQHSGCWPEVENQPTFI